MDYGEIFTRAWRYLWRYKILWLFGILNGCQTFNTSFSENDAAQQQAMAMLNRWASDSIVWLALGIFVLSILLAILILSLIGIIGIIRTVSLAEEGRTPKWGEIFANSWPLFWQLLGLHFLLGIFVMLIITIPIGISIFAAATLIPDQDTAIGLAVLGMLAIICICIFPFLFLLGPFINATRIALLLESLGIWGALRRGWQVYIRNFGHWLLLTIILFVIRIFVVLPVVILLALVPVSLALEFVIFIIGLLFFGGLNAFIDSVLTLAYLRLRSGPQVQAAESALSAL